MFTTLNRGNSLNRDSLNQDLSVPGNLFEISIHEPHVIICINFFLLQLEIHLQHRKYISNSFQLSEQSELLARNSQNHELHHHVCRFQTILHVSFYVCDTVSHCHCNVPNFKRMIMNWLISDKKVPSVNYYT